MTRVLELNVADRFVTVEPGVTWQQVRDLLRPQGLTTPFWGTFSGRVATVGGAAAQGAKFFGSASHGGMAESVLGLRVVTGTGAVLVTGSAAADTAAASPFFRNYGPDLTGLFLGDCGAFGIKTAITLQLIPAPRAQAFRSYWFDDPARQMTAMGRIGADLLASECQGMDPVSARARMQGAGLLGDLRMIGRIVAGNRSRLDGLRDAALVALHGRRFAARPGYLMTCTTEGRDRREAASKARAIDRIARAEGGRPMPASIPRVMHALPFPEMNGLLTPSGKRMAWLHVVVPNSRGAACFTATEAVFARFAGEMKIHGIDRGYLLSTHGPSGVGVETLLRWSDAPLPLHLHHMTATDRARQRPRADNPAARAALERLTEAILSAWQDFGGVHLQIGRKYPYLATRLPATRQMVRDLKRLCDPDGVLVPGNLLDPLSGS